MCLVVDPQVLEVVQPGEGPLEDSAGLPEPGAVGGTVPGGPEGDAAVQEGTVVLVVVAAPVGEEPARPVTGAVRAGHGCAGIASRSGSSRVTSLVVSAGRRDGERGAVPVDDQVVLAARPAPADRRRPGASPFESP